MVISEKMGAIIDMMDRAGSTVGRMCAVNRGSPHGIIKLRTNKFMILGTNIQTQLFRWVLLLLWERLCNN